MKKQISFPLPFPARVPGGREAAAARAAGGGGKLAGLGACMKMRRARWGPAGLTGKDFHLWCVSSASILSSKYDVILDRVRTVPRRFPWRALSRVHNNYEPKVH